MAARRSTPPGSVWLRPERPARDRQLSRSRIVGTAIEILDAEGHDGLSMRKVAERLAVTAGSLYWYVATKDELLELTLDAVIAETEPPGESAAEARDSGEAGEAGLDWRRALAAIASGHRAMLLRHPWVISLLSTQPNMGPNALRATERVLRILTGAGFPPDTLDAAHAAITDQVIGAVTAEIAWRRVVEGGAGTLTDWRQAATGYLHEIEECHPLLAARLASGPADIEQVCERRFTFAIDCLLDGMQARLRHTEKAGETEAEAD